MTGEREREGEKCSRHTWGLPAGRHGSETEPGTAEELNEFHMSVA